MDHRIRFALGLGPGAKLAGEVEVDESFIGGKARNMHRGKRAERITGTGGKDKVIVMGMLERGGKARTGVLGNRRKQEIQATVREHIEAGSAIFSDELKSYEGLEAEYQHAVINHAVEYVNGNVHTNGMENFWSLLKRGLHGTYVSVEPFYIFRYLDEQTFRFNNRKMTDAERFDLAVKGIVGKRVTYEQLTGKESKGSVNASVSHASTRKAIGCRGFLVVLKGKYGAERHPDTCREGSQDAFLVRLGTPRTSTYVPRD